MPIPARWLQAGLIVLLAAVYFAAAKVSLSAAIPPGYATPIWPPSGIALAALLLGGNRLWPGVWIGSFAARLDQSRAYTTREFLYLLGKELGKDCSEHGIVSAAAKHGVPLFCPAVADSSIGIGIAESRHRGENRLMFDMIGDVLEITSIVSDSPATGVIYFGGGTPKNYVQQTEVVAMLMNTDKTGHRYGVQVVTDAPHWGGLSGCTF